MPKIGGHVSVAISLELAFKKAQEIQAECIQFFVSPPQRWLQTKHDEAEIERFKTAQAESGIGPNFIHGTYLVNLGTTNPDHLQKSIDWLIYGLEMAEKLGVEGVIFHTGSHKGAGFESVLPQVSNALTTILNHPSVIASGQAKQSQGSEKKPLLILEISAGGGGSIGRDFHELGQILKQVNNHRLKVCIDTQHAFAAGYDMKTLVGLKDVIEEFEEEIGLENLAAFHANDSKTEYKSNRDRHENIGEGFIGKEGFENMLNHPKLKDVPFLLEVPGYSDNGPDLENVQTLNSLRK
jgi:deoxyribonuclease-4